MIENKAHAKLSPSSSHRWILCPGSIALSEKCPPQKDTSYSIEGTAAHSLGEQCLLTGKDAKAFIGTKIKTEKMTSEIEVTSEMAVAVQVYVDLVREQMKAPGVGYGFERKFDLSWLIKDCFGSNDAYVVNPAEKKLMIFDYKNGSGIEVDAEWNSQLMMYALGALHGFKGAKFEIDKIEMIVVQPNLYSEDAWIKSWTIAREDLIFWAHNVLVPCALETQRPKARLAVGDHCRFCPALAVCPEQVKNAMIVAKTDFDNPILPRPEELTPQDLAKVMRVSSIFSNWANGVAAYAQQLAEQGTKIPGHKLVAKKVNRAWKNESEVETILSMSLGDDAYKKKLISPKQAEDQAKARGLSKNIFAEYVYRPEAGVTLVNEDDKRPEVFKNAALEFLDDADFLR